MEVVMLYPVYVHPGDEAHAHGITIPDFPGCFSAADSWEELPSMIQEAAEVVAAAHTVIRPGPVNYRRSNLRARRG